MKRSPWRLSVRKTLTILTSASLVLSLVPTVPAHAAQEGRWSDSISAMLASGEYAEGEAIVALMGDEEEALTAQAALPVDALEPLMEVGSEAAGVAAGEGLVMQAEQDVTLALVSSDTRSTEDLLRSLADDPRVAFAEPNYYMECAEEDDAEAVADAAAEMAAIDEEPVSADDGDAVPSTQAPEASASSEVSEAPVSAGLVPQASGVIDDLRYLQWSHWDTTGEGLRSPSTMGNYSINVPNFDVPQVGANMTSEVVVAVLDGAVDFTNPDLVDRAYTFSPEQQAQLGCDEHGFNASAESTDGKLIHNPSFVTDNHGTHCAGIIGASWDGRGTSGVASNAKIVSVQMLGSRTEEESHRTSLGNGLRGFDFVKRANEAGVGIQITSNSWGFSQASKALNAAMYELGTTQGVVSVLAASNDGLDNDTHPYMTSTYRDNPYVIVVAASSQADERASFSNYGAKTVDLAAPGVAILSTVASGNSMYIPGATDSDIMLEDFEDDDPIVTVQQIDGGGNLVGEPASVCTNTHVRGARGIAVPVDSECLVDIGSWFPIYVSGFRFDFDLAAAQERSGIDVVQALASAQDLYVGFGIATDKDCVSAALSSVKSNMTGDAEMGSTSPSNSSHGSACTTYAPLTAEGVERKVSELNGHLLVDVFITADDASCLYFDTIAIGTEKVPYAYKSGTSMACPAVAGAAVVLASQTGLKGAELASLVRSKVRIPEAGNLPVRTGGVFDFDVQSSPDEGDNAVAPVISSMSVSGTTVTLTGSNFGAQPGSVDLMRYMVAQDDGPVVPANVTSWSDGEVTLVLNEPFTGILSATLTNTAGKRDIVTRFVSKGETVFEQDLPFDAGSGKPFALDGIGDLETRGPLVGLGCKLYYLPVQQSVEESPAYQRMLCFDLKTQTWSELPGLPEFLQGISAVMYEGKIVVEGATMQVLPSGEPTNEFVGDVQAEERVYVYDPEKAVWSKASDAGMFVGQTILNNEGQLMLVGGLRYVEYPDEPEASGMEPAPAFNYNLAEGALEELYPVYGLMSDPQAVVRNGDVYLYNPKNYDLSRVKDGQPSMCREMLPAIAIDSAASLTEGQQVADPHTGWGVLMNASDGIIFVGPPAADGSTETYILRDGAERFVPYEKRASEDRVYNPAACTYRGRLFVIGSAWFEPDMRLFRATALDVPEYPGDLPCEEDSKPDTPTPDTPTPDNPTPDKPTPDTPAKPSTPSKGTPAKASGTQNATKVTPTTGTGSSTVAKTLPKTGDSYHPSYVAGMAALGLLAVTLGLRRKGREA